jgi:hypothetical protein
LTESLRAFARGQDGPSSLLPWADRLCDQASKRLRQDLAVVLSEPERTAEPLDWREIGHILREYAETVAWQGELILPRDAPPDGAEYRVEVRAQDLRALERASAAVQQAAREVLARFLPVHPTAHDRLTRGSLKKLGNRFIWQIELPDGYRLRYYVAEPERTVYVVYLGPHPDGDMSGREEAVIAMVQRNRHGR